MTDTGEQTTPPPVVFTFDDDLSPDRLSDRATNQLRTLIMTLQLQPGTVLDEVALSQRFGCGRTPLREAIQRLTSERLVVILPRRAVAVTPITVTDLQQIHEARLYFEGAAARLAALRASADQIQTLQQHVDSLEFDTTKQNALQIVRSDFVFHHLVAQAADNQYVCDTISRILGPAMRLTYLAHKHGQSSRETKEEHAAIFQAIATRDADAADREMRGHLLRAKDRTLRRL